MQALEKGRFRARLAAGRQDVARAQALRHLCFRGGPGQDADRFDAACRHVLVEEATTQEILACFRLLAVPDAAALAGCYAAQFYDLAGGQAVQFPAVEMGRFCIAPGQGDADILRLAWAAMTRLVDQGGYLTMFGCTSFPGADLARHGPALAALRPYAIAAGQGPGRKAAETRALAEFPAPADGRAALAGLPAILRSYLGMGGWVSDHVVVDRDLNTLHVFTAVDVAKVPPARARALRALAG